MLDRAAPLRLTVPPPLPLDRLLIGRAAAEAADLLARLFNLCGAAQALAARLAMGLTPAGDPASAIASELAREARFHLLIRLPQALELPVAPPPGALEPALFGPGGLAAASADPARFLAGSAGIAPLLRHLARAGAALPPAARLPVPQGAQVFQPGPWDNSPAGRRADHPLLVRVEASRGRDALWRVLGRAVDACLPLPAPQSGRDGDTGWAVVPAARGAYGLRVRLDGGRLAALCRVTPTDHALAEGAPLRQAIAATGDPALASLALLLFDPCVPVGIEKAHHA